jgi:glycerophosphoryl diester phosphodiesterase
MKNFKNYRQFLFLLLLQSIFLLPGNAFGSNKGRKHYINAGTSHGLQELLRYTGERVPFISSHRGGPSKGFPENCVGTFKNTLNHTYSLMEIDPRYTKDSVMVVHHDAALDRTTTGHGLVSDFNYNELKGLKLKDPEGNVTSHRIPTLKKMLKWANGKTVLVLDKKDVPIGDRVKMVEACKAESCAVVMAYTFEEARQCYQMNQNIMMQVFINSKEKVMEFEKTGVPWRNVMVFVSHEIPGDLSVFELVHQKGALCILGTSRNLDKELSRADSNDMQKIKHKYLELFELGADILETDIPVPVSKLFPGNVVPSYYSKYFN